MRWGYKMVKYPWKKEGLLGSAFLDEVEIEISLNEYGKAGWELVNILETVNGLSAIFKQPLSLEDDFVPAALETPTPRRAQRVQQEEYTPLVEKELEEFKETKELQEDAIPVSQVETSLSKQKKRRDVVIQPLDVGSIRIK